MIKFLKKKIKKINKKATITEKWLFKTLEFLVIIPIYSFVTFLLLDELVWSNELAFLVLKLIILWLVYLISARKNKFKKRASKIALFDLALNFFIYIFTMTQLGDKLIEFFVRLFIYCFIFFGLIKE